MQHRFEKHYTREEANALLPQIRKWLTQLNRLREDLHRYEKRLNGLTEQGNDIGGETVNSWIRVLADMLKARAGRWGSARGEGAGMERGTARRISAAADFHQGIWSAVCWIFLPSSATRKFFSAGNRTRKPWRFWHVLETGFGGRERL